ncbi:hypothetical protein ODD70_004072 [Salmonella enterica]|nr:hypothetical protein [Salmonella enterica]EJX0849803.1 hypothetical protein [Salmonella enterica]
MNFFNPVSRRRKNIPASWFLCRAAAWKATSVNNKKGNADWPKPREAGIHMVTAQPTARPFSRAQYSQTLQNSVDEIDE